MSKEKQIWDLVSRILDSCGEESDDLYTNPKILEMVNFIERSILIMDTALN